MEWSELLISLNLVDRDIIATIIKPIRNDEWAKSGTVTGFKSGLYGGGHSRWKGGMPHSFSSLRMRFIKKPRVHITYNCFEWGKKEYSDWVDVDNCTFSFKDNKSSDNGKAQKEAM
jgi:hypothetical protein